MDDADLKSAERAGVGNGILLGLMFLAAFEFLFFVVALVADGSWLSGATWAKPMLMGSLVTYVAYGCFNMAWLLWARNT